MKLFLKKILQLEGLFVVIVALSNNFSGDIFKFKLSPATVAMFMYAKAETSAFVCLKILKNEINLQNFLILHIYAAKKFVSYESNICEVFIRATFVKYFVSQFMISCMPINASKNQTDRRTDGRTDRKW